MLTIFTAPKPFTNPHIDLIQRNAIRSWVALGPEVEVLLIGEEEGLAEAARELGVRMTVDSAYPLIHWPEIFDGAELVLSGLLGREVPGVLAAYRGQGFALARRYDIDGWATLLLRRGGAQPLPQDDDDDEDDDD